MYYQHLSFQTSSNHCCLVLFRFSNGSSPSNTVATPSPVTKKESVTISPLMQTSTESIADLQPAAPEVVLPQQSPTSASMSEVLESIVDKSKCEPKVSAPAELELQSNSTGKEVCSSTSSIAVELGVEETKDENAGHKFLKVSTCEVSKFYLIPLFLFV